MHLECAIPIDHHGGTTIEWHHFLGWPVLLFEADSFKSISKSAPPPPHLIKSHGLKLLPIGNQCCLSCTPTTFPRSGANMPVTAGRMAQVNHMKHKCV